ncbi:MAG: HAD family hydrolase [Candidatus Cloacimonetes bacterium]|nr:HAD family hydrolase [Candidatus Cloacimonadota bacterium]
MFATFLDRDGTINLDEKGYLSDPDMIELLPGAGEAIARLNSLECLVFVVTNQSGIARGYFTLDDMHAVHQRLRELLAACGAHLDDIFFAPWHKDGTVEPWNRNHPDRKPGLGMFETARRKHNFDVKASWMVGDKESDITFGRRAGLRTALVRTGMGESEFLQRRGQWALPPDFVVDDLAAAAELIAASTASRR